MKPRHDDYEEFCEEPQLSAEEREEYEELSVAINAPGGDIIHQAMKGAVSKERAALNNTFLSLGFGDDWGDMVRWLAASRRLMRAELRWWRKRE